MGDWLTIREVAAATRRSRQWVNSRISDGTFGTWREGGRVLVRSMHVAAWLEREITSMGETLRHYLEHVDLLNE